MDEFTEYYSTNYKQNDQTLRQGSCDFAHPLTMIGSEQAFFV